MVKQADTEQSGIIQLLSVLLCWQIPIDRYACIATRVVVPPLLWQLPPTLLCQ